MPPLDRPISSGRALAVALGPLPAELRSASGAITDAVLRVNCRPQARLEDADAYVAIVGTTSEPGAQPDYDRAAARGIPRLVFLAADVNEHAGFIGRLRAENACERFGSVPELQALIAQGLRELRDGRLTGPDVPPGEPLVVTVVPKPPEFYTAPPYLLQGSRFVGRRAELDALDAWAASGDPLMVVEAIGGMGKSALTWEWARGAAPGAIRGLAGRVWWSFYERGTSMKMFLRHALAYVTGRAPNDFLNTNTYDLGHELVVELRRRPFLIVLDGFERVLTAYHRSDKAQLRDDLVPTGARECTNPRDGEVLRMLLRCGPSKVLVSTRLMPAVLEIGAAPLPGVRRLVLAGLAEGDALAMAHAAGVRGDAAPLLAFADQFDRHPLLLRIACGLVADYAPAPGDFGAWSADPNAGGGLKLADLAARNRYTHLLEYAFRALEPRRLQLLSRIAILSDAADYDTVAVLNPFLPPPPEPVARPPRNFDLTGFQDRIARESDPARRAALEEHLAHALAAHARRQREWEENLAAVREYPVSPAYRRGMAEFHAALADLEERGLLQWDRGANTYDLHPVVRAYAFDILETGERELAFGAIGDYFAGRQDENPLAATELSHLKNSVEIVRAFTGAGRGGAAAQFLRGRLSEALLFTVGAHHTLIELLPPLLGPARTGQPLLTDWRDRSYFMNNLAIALNSVGRVPEAKVLYTDAARLDLNAGDLFNLETALRSLARCMQRGNELAGARRLLDLSRDLARATGDHAGLTAGLLDRLQIAATLGRADDAERLYTAFHRRPPLPPHLYRSGAAEHLCAVARFHSGELTEHDLEHGERHAAGGRGVQPQHQLAALRAEWELSRGNAGAALRAIESALATVRRTGESAAEYLGLRAHALAKLGRGADARDALDEGVREWDGFLPRFPFHAGETCSALGGEEEAREHVLRAFRCAWADGPQDSHRYYLERCRARLSELRTPEPFLPAFTPEPGPGPFETAVRAIVLGLAQTRPPIDDPC